MKNQKGTSLVSVIVSFLVLMIVLLLLQISITASGRYAARADEVWEQAAKAENRYVNDENTGTGQDVNLIMKSGTGDEDWGLMHVYTTKKDSGDTVQIYYIKP